MFQLVLVELLGVFEVSEAHVGRLHGLAAVCSEPRDGKNQLNFDFRSELWGLNLSDQLRSQVRIDRMVCELQMNTKVMAFVKVGEPRAHSISAEAAPKNSTCCFVWGTRVSRDFVLTVPLSFWRNMQGIAASKSPGSWLRP